GHEIASHGVGHFNGAAWSVGDWKKEFRAFGDILKNVGRNNRLSGSQFAFAATDVIGFRAPYLAKGAGLYGALKAHGFRYTPAAQRLAGEDRRPVAVQFGHAANPRLGQGHAVDGLQFLHGPVARRLRSAPLRNGARADAANLSAVLQEQLRR